jgi:flagellin
MKQLAVNIQSSVAGSDAETAYLADFNALGGEIDKALKASMVAATTMAAGGGGRNEVGGGTAMEIYGALGLASMSFMSYLVFGIGSCGMAPSLSARQSAPVNTPRTPGIASAALLSMETMRAWG